MRHKYPQIGDVMNRSHCLVCGVRIKAGAPHRGTIQSLSAVVCPIDITPLYPPLITTRHRLKPFTYRNHAVRPAVRKDDPT